MYGPLDVPGHPSHEIPEGLAGRHACSQSDGYCLQSNSLRVVTLAATWGVLSFAMFCFIFFRKFWLPIGLHYGYSVSPMAGGTCQNFTTKHREWGDTPQGTLYLRIVSQNKSVKSRTNNDCKNNNLRIITMTGVTIREFHCTDKLPYAHLLNRVLFSTCSPIYYDSTREAFSCWKIALLSKCQLIFLTAEWR